MTHSRTYYVFGDYGYADQCELYASTSLSEAEAFARKYVRWGDFGGYNEIAVCWFADDGEYVEELQLLQCDEDA